MAFNLVRSIQVATGANERARARKRPAIFALQTIQTLRYRRLNRAGTIVHPHGRLTLEVGVTGDTKRRFQLMAQQVARLA